ncbi:hypothetical protein LOD99_8373 [Oopsacas minuta]|uniref:Uncharacterized protein n=1 Tax=Oopsacas minuta TaxID=111878 RepID=A0AAV7JGB7_9METZ|nr:hypothetical protein LOD99_8373 [Oopsacas minuta]
MNNSKDAHDIISKWYNTIQLEVSSLREWNELSDQLYSAIISQLDDISQFHTFSPKEKEKCISDALKQISSNNSNSMQRISRTISSTVNDSLARHGLSDRQSSLLNVSDFMLDKPGNACEMRSQFSKYLNRSVPPHMRCLVWKSCLQAHNLERVIELTIKRQQIHTGDSLHKIKTLLNDFSNKIGSITDTVEELLAECLYYYTEVIFQDYQPRLQHIKLLYPFVIAVLDSPQTSTLLSSPIVPNKSGILSKILALFITFLQTAPEFVQSDSSTNGTEMWLKEFSLNVTALIKSHEAILYHFLCGLTYNSEPQLVSSLAQLFKPFIQDMFVGHMQTSLVHFIWDNCFLCLDTPSMQFLPIAAACWLIILKRELMAVTRFDHLIGLLQTNSSSISVSIMQEHLHRLSPSLRSRFKSQTMLPLAINEAISLNQTNDSRSIEGPTVSATNTINVTNLLDASRVQSTPQGSIRHVMSEIELLNQSTDITTESGRNIQNSEVLNLETISSIGSRQVDEETQENISGEEIRSSPPSAENIPDSLETEDEDLTLEFWEKIINKFHDGLHKVAHYEVESNT